MPVSHKTSLPPSLLGDPVSVAVRLPVFVAGAALLVAGVAKVVSSPSANPDFLRLWLSSTVLEFLPYGEIFFGCWFLSSIQFRAAQYVATSIFLGMVVVSGFQVVLGEPSCGCFGPAAIPSSWVFAFDCFLLASLVFSTVVSRYVVRESQKWTCVMAATVPRICLASAVGLFLTAANESRSFDVADVVGSRFSLLDSIDIDADLEEGKWMVLLWRPGCPKCERLVDSFEIWSRTGHLLTFFLRTRHYVGLVQLPIGSDAGVTPEKSTRDGLPRGHCLHSQTHSIPTPTLVWLNWGIVDRVSTLVRSPSRGIVARDQD